MRFHLGQSGSVVFVVSLGLISFLCLVGNAPSSFLAAASSTSSSSPSPSSPLRISKGDKKHAPPLQKGRRAFPDPGARRPPRAEVGTAASPAGSGAGAMMDEENHHERGRVVQMKRSGPFTLDEKDRKDGGGEDSSDGGEDTMVWMTEQPGIREGVEKGAYAGRNRKKLKHRRLDAVEVMTRKLEEKGLEKRDGSLDEDGLMALLDAETEREKAIEEGYSQGVPMKTWTLEELDQAFPTEEGNVRLGLKNASDVEYVGVERLERYERSSNFVEMRRPAAKNTHSALHDQVINYTPSDQMMTVFVEGSTGVRYAVTVHEFELVESFKAKVWDLEREHRYSVGGKIKARDKAEGFKIEEQQVLFNAKNLEPDSTTLKSLNVTENSLMLLQPKAQEITREQAADIGEFWANMCYEHERFKAMEIESDSEAERNPEYREFKASYIEANKQTFEHMASMYPSLRAMHTKMLREMPNAGVMPHYKATEENLGKLREKMDKSTVESFFEEFEKEMREFEAEAREPPIITHEMLAQPEIEVTEEAVGEFLLRKRENGGLPMVHFMEDDGQGNFTRIGGDEYSNGQIIGDSLSNLVQLDELENNVGEHDRNSGKGDELFPDEKMREEDVKTFSISEELLDQVKTDWIQAYGANGTNAGRNGEEEEFDIPFQFGNE